MKEFLITSSAEHTVLLKMLLGSWPKDGVFQRKLSLQASNVDKVVKACVVLHNYPQDTRDIPALYNRLNPDHDQDLIYLQDDGAILAVPNLYEYHSSEQARAIRNIYKTYFTRPEGDVYWQNRAIPSVNLPSHVIV